jgi:hypothetical protein
LQFLNYPSFNSKTPKFTLLIKHFPIPKKSNSPKSKNDSSGKVENRSWPISLRLRDQTQNWGSHVNRQGTQSVPFLFAVDCVNSYANRLSTASFSKGHKLLFVVLFAFSCFFLLLGNCGFERIRLRCGKSFGINLIIAGKLKRWN